MRLGQIIHVNVIANAGSIRCRIVVAINLQNTALSVDRLERHGNQVGFRIVNLANFSAFIGPGSVEITKAHET